MSHDYLAYYLEARLRAVTYGCESGVDDDAVKAGGNEGDVELRVSIGRAPTTLAERELAVQMMADHDRHGVRPDIPCHGTERVHGTPNRGHPLY